MAGKSERSKLVLAPEEVKELQQLAQSRTAPSREVQRARILCRYHAGETITEIARALRMTATAQANGSPEAWRWA